MDWELSMMAWFSGCLARTVASEDGILRWPNIEQAIPERQSSRCVDNVDRD